MPSPNEKNEKLLFHLSPNDLVYVPTLEEIESNHQIDLKNLTPMQKGRIYKMISSSGNQCFFVKQETSAPIVNKLEYSALNKMERSLDGVMIKDVCQKLNVTRIGGVTA